jgi:predicted Zn finger-like uncharacterized protein
MILTCPECATSYFVDDDRIPAAGRTVKCSSCGARWKAIPEGAQEREIEAAAPVETTPEPELEAAVPELSGDDIEFVPSPIRTGKKQKTKGDRAGGSRGLVIGVLMVGLLAAAAGALAVFREQVAGMVPGSAPIFAAVGLRVNELGLNFENVVWKPTFVAGRPVMAVTGAIRNTTEHAINSPPVRVSLLDKDRTVLVTYDLTVTNARVPPGGVRHFAWNLPDPPAGMEKLDIGFNPAARVAAAAPPMPADAQPLPPDASDALSKHE